MPDYKQTGNWTVSHEKESSISDISVITVIDNQSVVARDTSRNRDSACAVSLTQTSNV